MDVELCIALLVTGAFLGVWLTKLVYRDAIKKQDALDDGN
jgi:hypothetical protein